MLLYRIKEEWKKSAAGKGKKNFCTKVFPSKCQSI